MASHSALRTNDMDDDGHGLSHATRHSTGDEEESGRMVHTDVNLSDDDDGVGHPTGPDTNNGSHHDGPGNGGMTTMRMVIIGLAIALTAVMLIRSFASTNTNHTNDGGASPVMVDVNDDNLLKTARCPAGFIPTLSSSSDNIDNDDDDMSSSSSSRMVICMPCSAGYFCASPTDKTICPIGSYCPAASSAPIACASSQTTSNSGATNELSCHCAVGSYITMDKAAPCTSCPAGTFCPDGVRLYSCSCGTSAIGSSSSAACICDGSGHSDDTNPSSPIDAVASSSTASSSSSSSSSSSTGTAGTDVNTCPLGHICTNGISTICPANHWCPAGASAPISCGARSLSVAGTATASSCTCDTTSYAVITTSSGPPRCHLCLPGTICDGTPVTKPCPVGSFCPNGIHVVECPPTSPKSPSGATSDSQCRAAADCDDGQFKDGGGQCASCPRGYYCPNGRDRQPCPEGFWCAAATAHPIVCIRLGIADNATSISSGQSEDGHSDPCWHADDSAAQAPPKLTSWHMKPMADVIDDNTGWADDHEDGPRLTQNAAVIRCDRIHLRGDGVSLAQFRYWTVLEQAMCSHRHWILPSWRARYDSDDFLPWEAVWEWKNFSRGLTRHYGIAAVLPRRMQQQQLASVGFGCIADNAAMPAGGTQVSYGSWGEVGTQHNADGNIMAFLYLRPAPHLQLVVDMIRRQWAPNGNVADNNGITCLHLRTEQDWVDVMQGEMRRQSLQQIAQRFKSSYQLAYGDTTIIPTIARPNDDGNIHARLFASQRLYIAGEHTIAAINEIQQLFGWMYPRGIYSKANIVTNVANAWDKTRYTNLELSVIDREVCSTADQFVGNAFSGWTISVYGRRIYSPGHNSMGTWLANGQYNWMTNPLAKEEVEPRSGPLNPLCPAAFVKCPHYLG